MTDGFILFVVLAFLPIVILFQCVIGLMIASIWKRKIPENTYKKYFTYWVYGFFGSLIIGLLFIVLKFAFQEVMVFLFKR